MLKHVIAPARSFTQIPNEIIRHPRLSLAAKGLLLFQLALPPGVDLSLSEAAGRAGIKKTAFGRAKNELRAEGYVHEWRRQTNGGRWATTQLISNVPLTAEEARAVRDGAGEAGRAPVPVPPAPTPPTVDAPAIGAPTPPAVGRSQEKTGENTSHPPHHPLADRAAQALTAVTRGERRLRLSSRDVSALAPLAAEWLQRGATLMDLREALTADLPQPVRSARGLLRNRLLRKLPDPDPAPEPRPRPQPLRACEGGCGRIIRPVADETACRECRRESAAAVHDTSGAVAATERGMAAVRAALRMA